jgi:hypothetical protein
MNGVDLPTVKEILGHSEINMTMRYSHLAPAHKAKAVQQLGDALEQIQQGPLDRQAEAATGAQTATNLARFRHVLVVKSGRGLAVIGPKKEQNQQITADQDWWRRGESNPRPKVFHLGDYMLSRCFDLAPQAPSGRVSRSQPVWISASSPPAGESANPTK